MNFKLLTEYLDNLYETEGVPSSDLIVYHKGKEVYRHTAGFQDVATGEPLRPDALYNVYSATKLITVMAGMQLFERGKFLMSDPVGDYIPAFAHMKVEHTNSHGAIELTDARPMRVRDLFNMTSGLDYTMHTPAIQAVVDGANGAPTTAQVIDALAKRPLRFQPGDRWMYGTSHDVLLRLVEVVSGEIFSEYAKKNIFEPIGMENTYFHADESIYARMASQYRFDKELNRAVDVGKGNPSFGPLFESGGAGVISCTEDYGRFAETLTHLGVAPTGERVLAERTVELMRSDCLTDVNRATFDWPRFRGYGYGYGVRVLKDPGLSGNLTPAGEFGWGGMAGAYVHCEPGTQTSIVYMQHMLKNKEDIIHPRLRNLVYAGLDRT